ncbi:hypothetical protein HNQ68_003149 [Pseudochrobactrum saccharolyticum]|uniref:Uncharacterized protein n=1 Tax=Pseudochrobactrum saccharolyticum TaxID=354352 RepID=A0A7W8ALH7_9HYPH|nr:hypothetical protein [Pseudochrobactrum saccharolyticum]KAB0537038.1 hypothetical protein F7P81_16560 [Pseudochrobactrum saccharolyticum]MBB5092592.1 hypothetical protein [Pseudochrobactrum saccharolyticum]
MQPNIMNVAQMKLVSSAFTAIAITLGTMNASNAEQVNIPLFLEGPTAETTIDALRVIFRSELVDQNLTERTITERPRVSLSCNDKKLQVLHLYIPKDLNPWKSLTKSFSTKGEVKSVGAFSAFTGSVLAANIGEGLDISMDVGSTAAGIGRSWYDGMSITIDIPSADDLPELNIVLFGAEPRPHFRTEMAATIKACEILSGS